MQIYNAQIFNMQICNIQIFMQYANMQYVNMLSKMWTYYHVTICNVTIHKYIVHKYALCQYDICEYGTMLYAIMQYKLCWTWHGQTNCAPEKVWRIWKAPQMLESAWRLAGLGHKVCESPSLNNRISKMIENGLAMCWETISRGVCFSVMNCVS